MIRGEIRWATLPGQQRPVLVLQADAFNRSMIWSVVAAMITSNLALAGAPGAVRVPATESGLGKDCVIDVSQVVTVEKARLGECAGTLPARYMRRVEDGLRLVLGL